MNPSMRQLKSYESVIDCESCGTGMIVDNTNSDGIVPFYPYEHKCGACK